MLICAAAAACTSERQTLRVGTTYTVEQSGAVAALDSLTAPAALSVVIASSGQILRAAAAGDLDVVVTHAPSLERRILVGPGLAALRCPFVASRFAVVGPASDPAGVADARTAADALRRIAAARAPFVSRGDSSGTHVKEIALWAAAGVAPDGQAWYVQSGVDQAATLHLADERRGYALADLPTFARVGGLALRVLFTRDSTLVNPYTLYVVRAAGRPATAQATAFGSWALGAWRTRLLARRLPDGSSAFASRPGACEEPSMQP